MSWKRESLFNGFWYDEHGQRINRIYRSEYGELYRLWAVHKDIREGRVDFEPLERKPLLELLR